MNVKGQDRLAAFVALAGALLAAVIALNSHSDPSMQSAGTEPAAAATSALDAELARCKTIAPEGANDAVCKAAWERNRRRFFESREPRQDTSINPIPATPQAREEPPKGVPQSRATQTSISPGPSGDIAGHPK
jgi:conjugative transfer region protein TrbK